MSQPTVASPLSNPLAPYFSANVGVLAVETREIPRVTHSLVRDYPGRNILQLRAWGGLKDLRTGSQIDAALTSSAPTGLANAVTRVLAMPPLVSQRDAEGNEIGKGAILIVTGVPQRPIQGAVQDMLLENMSDLRNKEVCVVLLADSWELGTLRDYVALATMPLAEGAELEAAYDAVEPDEAERPTHEERGDIVRNVAGLPLQRAEDAIALAHAKKRVSGGKTVAALAASEKVLLLRDVKLEAADPIDPNAGGAAEVGGLGELDEFLDNEVLPAAYTDDAVRSILLLGCQGCGKSLSARSLAAKRNVQLVRMPFSELKGGIVGDSAKNMAAACRGLSAFGPHVLWIDEMDDATGSASSSAHTGDTTAEMVGILATWMDTMPTHITLICTANNVLCIPLKLRRRFDETFFVDLPTSVERVMIAFIQLRKRGVTEPLLSPLAAHLGSVTEGYTGDEIRKVVASASRRTARNFTEEAITLAASKIEPLSRTSADEIQVIREYGKRYRRANTPEPGGSPEPKPTNKRRVGPVGRG